MIKNCSRDNSLDSSLEDEKVNDLAAFLEAHPSIRKVAFTGKKSQALFETHFGYLDIERVYLPSPSAAYAKMNIDEKTERYKKELS